MKRTTWSITLALATTFVLGSGCAKPDWIQQTLVTVDVTGAWVGSTNRPGGGTSTAFDVRLELEQNGPKVRGSFRTLGAGTSGVIGTVGSGPIEGTVAGDVFTFQRTDGSFTAEVTVSGDEMAGSITANTRIPLSLRRINASPQPASKP